MNRIKKTILVNPSLWPSAIKATVCRIIGLAETRLKTHGVTMMAKLQKGQGVWCSIGGLEYEPEMRTVIGLLNPGDIFIDVGANVGVYTLHAARKVGASGKVLFFEPTLETYEAAKLNVSLNGFSHVKGFNEAVADHPGQLEFVVCKSGNSNYIATGSVLENSRQKLEIRRVPVNTIDAMVEDHGLEKVDFIKIDAEGAEPMVLRGAQKVIDRDKPSVLFESCNDADHPEFGFFLSRGYQILHHTPSGWIPVQAGQGGNFLALARDSHQRVIGANVRH